MAILLRTYDVELLAEKRGSADREGRGSLRTLEILETVGVSQRLCISN